MSVAVMIPAELEQRAGASDGNRSAWLAERRSGVTATEVKRLYMEGASFKRELIKDKLSGVDQEDLSHVPIIKWGRDREPVIAAAVLDRYAIAPESRVFHAADNPRFLASPDGLGVDFDENLRGCEIKTSGKNVAVGSEGFAEKGYMLQMQWCMRVTGARRWLYAWEYRLPDGQGGFVPGLLSFEWIEYDEKLAAELELVALDFLADLDAARVALEAGEGPVVDEELDTLAVNLLRFREMEADGRRAKAAAWDQLLGALAERGKDFSQRSALAQITYTADAHGTKEEVDEQAAREADPKLWTSVVRAELALKKKREAWAAHAAGFTNTVQTVTQPRLTVVTPKEAKGMGK